MAVLDLPADPPAPDVPALAVINVSRAPLPPVTVRPFFPNCCFIPLRSARGAAGLSLGQDLAGNACVAFSLIGDLERAVSRPRRSWFSLYVHFEAGAIGHRLYLAAEAFGLAATGIGAFYDEEVHRYLNLTPKQGQVVYHFAIGFPVPDSWLSA